MIDLYRRLRHTYGFGVHSPLAYRLVREVLNPRRGLAWYGYEDIDLWFDHKTGGAKDTGRYALMSSLRRDACLLLRLATFLGVRKVWLAGNAPSVMEVALKGADSRMKIYRKRSDMMKAELIVDFPASSGGLECYGILNDNTECPKLVFFPKKREKQGIQTEGLQGVLLSGRRKLLFLPASEGAFHSYDVL